MLFRSALLAATDRFHFRRTVQRDARRLAQQTKQPLADIVEFNHLAQRRQAVSAGDDGCKNKPVGEDDSVGE